MILWNQPWVPEYVGARAGCRSDFGNCRTAGVFHMKRPIAGLVFHNWSPEFGLIEVSAAADDPRWASRGNLQELFGYVFSVAQTCVARIHEDNERARRLWRSFGATEHLLPRLRGREASEAIMLLTDDAWAESKYMRQANVEVKISRAA